MVRLLRRPGEGAPEAVDEDHDAAVLDGKGIPPQAQCVDEPEIGREERIRLLPRQEGRGARNPDHERVEGLGERRPAQLDRAKQGLGVGDGRRPREHGRRGPRPPQRAEDPAPNCFRCGREGEPQRRARDPLGCLGLVRIAAEQARELRVIEHERDAEERDARRQRLLDEAGEAPAL